MKPHLVIILSIIFYNLSAQPLAPSNLTASTTQVGLINLTWTDNSNNENGFLIEREFLDGVYTRLAFTISNTTTYQDYDVLPNVVYSYKIRSYNVNGYSGYSNTISITSLSNNPSNIAIWSNLNSGILDNINAIQFVNTSTGFAVANNSQILKSNNGGVNWAVNSLSVDGKNYQYTHCYFINSNVGWIAGDNPGNPSSVLIKTIDGGNTWDKQIGPFQIGGIIGTKDLFFMNNNVGWILGPREIYNTTNGGNSWAGYVIGDNNSIQYEAICFINENTGWAIGNNGAIMFTNDGCKSWSVQNVDVGLILRDIVFINNSIGFVVGDNGKLLVTTNGGITWSHKSISALNNLIKIEFCDANNGYILASDGRIFKTIDSGISWKPLVRFTAKNMLNLDFVNADIGYVCGSGGLIYKTTIGGTIPINAPNNLSAIYQNQNSVVLTWNDNSNDELGFIIERKTLNENTFIEIGNLSFNSTQFEDNNIISGQTYYYRIKAYNNDNESLYSNIVEITIPIPPPLPVQAPSELRIVGSIVGRVDLMWNDNSINESGFRLERKMSHESNYSIIGMTNENITFFRDDNIIERREYNYRVVAFNATMESEPSNIVTIITEYKLINTPTNLKAFANQIGKIDLEWRDNSDNEIGFIIERKTGTQNDFGFLDRVPANVEYYQDSSILENTLYEYRIMAYNIVTESNYSNIVSIISLMTGINNNNNDYELKLFQNYPNPFNPITNIKFSISYPAFVNLKVYNILGELISELVNDHLIPSEYVIKFNAVNLPNGIYYLKFTVGSFTETKKMILMK